MKSNLANTSINELHSDIDLYNETKTNIYKNDDLNKPFHIQDIFDNISEDDKDICIVEIYGIDSCYECDWSKIKECKQEYFANITNVILKVIHQFDDYEDKIFTLCLPKLYSIIMEFMNALNFIGFESTNFDSNLEFRIPMVYSRNKAGKRYFEKAYSNILKAYGIVEQ